MYNLHSHSLLSDGALLPSEICVRYQAAGYKTIAITDHADYSNINILIPALLNFVKEWPHHDLIRVLPGVELTHLPLEHFKPLAHYARKKGMKIIIAHGETPVEPVLPGTNRAALESDIDILAHPGYITEEDTRFAAQRGIFLEITSRKGHSQTNSHVARMALLHGAKLIINNDSHSPEDIIPAQDLATVAQQAQLTQEQIRKIGMDIESFLEKKEGR